MMWDDTLVEFIAITPTKVIKGKLKIGESLSDGVKLGIRSSCFTTGNCHTVFMTIYPEHTRHLLKHWGRATTDFTDDRSKAIEIIKSHMPDISDNPIIALMHLHNLENEL